jgi:terminase small subunit-like protein
MDNAAFREQYARARELQAHFYFEKITAIAFDDKSDFFVDGETGKVVSDHVRVARARLQVDALKWASAKLLPRVYGDRGDRHEQDEKPQAITIQWAASDAPAPAIKNLAAVASSPGQRTSRAAMAPAKPNTRKQAAARVTRSIEKLWGR